jgi:polyferredoxin
MKLITTKVSDEQCKDSGLALVLIALIISMIFSADYLLPIGTGLLIVTMSVPTLFRPFARIWFGFSHALGTLVSRILLTLLFYGLVTPVGFIRRVLGKDSMQLKKWKRGKGSVFNDRDHLFTRQDLDHPY